MRVEFLDISLSTISVLLGCGSCLIGGFVLGWLFPVRDSIIFMMIWVCAGLVVSWSVLSVVIFEMRRDRILRELYSLSGRMVRGD